MPPTEPNEIDWAEYEKAHPILVPTALESPHPITQRSAALRSWVIESPWLGPPPEYRECFHISLRHADPARVIRLVDTLLKACETRGFEPRYDDKADHHGISIVVAGEAIPIALIERGELVTHLSLEIGRRYEDRKKTWKDHPRRPLEKRLNEVMSYLRNMAYMRIARRQWLEDFRRNQEEWQRKRIDLRRQIKEEQNAVNELIAEAEGWQQAKKLRTYIRAVKVWAMQKDDIAEYADWIAWASDQADRFDPFCVSSPSVLDTPRDHYRELRPDESFAEDGSIEHA